MLMLRPGLLLDQLGEGNESSQWGRSLRQAAAVRPAPRRPRGLVGRPGWYFRVQTAAVMTTLELSNTEVGILLRLHSNWPGALERHLSVWAPWAGPGARSLREDFCP